MLPPATREHLLSQELAAAADELHRLSALGNNGKWPAKQVIPAWNAAHKAAGHLLRMGEILRGSRRQRR